jgi:ferredoxin
MKRKIIRIDEKKCTGCGQCIPDCPEGALQLIDGKARLVSDLFCDGLGACIGTCPEGAISVIERDTVPYDERAVMENIAKQGTRVIRAHLEHLAGHGKTGFYNEAIEYLIENSILIPEHKAPERRKPAPFGTRQARQAQPAVCHAGPHEPNPFTGCPGAATRSIPHEPSHSGHQQPFPGTSASELRQWPIQLALLNPAASYFKDADLLISADCVPFAYAGFHHEFLRGRVLINFCPKLDADIEEYIEKLAAIFKMHTIKSVTILRMEVPCCGGVRYIVEKAMEITGKTIPLDEKTVTIDGRIA